MFEFLTNLQFLIVYTTTMSSGIAIVLSYYYFIIRKKPIAEIFDKKGDILFKLGFVRLRKDAKTFTFRKEDYMVEWNQTAWIDTKTRPHLLYLKGEAKPLHLGNPKGLKVSNTASKLNFLSGKRTVEQLVKGALSTSYSSGLLIMLIILSIVAGIGIGVIIQPFIFPTPVSTPQTPVIPIP